MPGPNAVTLPAGTYVIRTALGPGDDAAASGDLDITGDLEILGAGAADTLIDGGRFIHPGFPESTFEIKSATVVMSDLTIMNGGEGLGHGGAIVNDGGNLTLNDVTVKNNVAFTGSGIASSGTLTINGGVFEHNLAGTGTGGGAIFNSGTMTLSRVRFTNNSGGIGAGAMENIGMATLTAVTADSNVSTSLGGIYNGGTMTVSGSTIVRSGGPAIFNEGELTLINSTVSSSSAFGIWNRRLVDLRNVTITGNSREGIINDNGPLPPEGHPGLRVSVENSIVAGNGRADCSDGNPNLESTVSAGHNLSGDGTCPFTASGDLQNTDPVLGPLADNGGPTQTHALLEGSPAIDAADDAACPATDQRGVTRPRGLACDIGAYESDFSRASPTPVPTPSPTPVQATPPPLAGPPTPAAALPAALPRTGGNPRS